MARKGTIKNMGKVKNKMSDAWKARKAAKSTPPATVSAKTERLRKAARAEINNRLAGGKQDHEVPTAKEVANNAIVEAAAKGKKAKGDKAPKTPKPPKPAKEPKAKRVSALDAAASGLRLGMRLPPGPTARFIAGVLLVFLVFVLMVVSETGVGNPAAHCGGQAWPSRFPATPRGVCQQPATRSISLSTSWTIELVAAARPRRSVP